MLNAKRQSAGNCALAILFCLIAALFFFYLAFTQRYFLVFVDGGSMEETLQDGDVLYADRTIAPARGDIVILDVSHYSGAYHFRGGFLIKRVIGLGGDAVKCENGVLLLRKAGEEEFLPVEEDFIVYPTPEFDAVEVGEGELFFLGDHRNNSTDSRELGCFRVEDVAGVVPAWALEHKDGIRAWEEKRLFRP